MQERMAVGRRENSGLTKSAIKAPGAASSPGRRRKRVSPAVSAAKQALLEEKRQEILDVAERLIQQHGYVGTTMEMITETLGASKPYVYYYFRNKQQVFETLCWRPSEACFTVMDFPADDGRGAHEKLAEGLERLLAETIRYAPASFFSHLYPQAHTPEFSAKIRALARNFYARMCALLEEAKRDGTVDCDNPMLTALAACSIPGFLFTWYKSDGRLSPDEMVRQLTPLMYRVLGLRLSGE